MKCTLHKKENRKTQSFSGGRISELASGPSTREQDTREQDACGQTAGTGETLWHLKLLAAEQEETALPQDEGCDRVLMVLDGEAVISYENQRVARLKALEQDRCDGDWPTTVFGRTAVYELAVRKGSEGYLDLIFPQKENTLCRASEENERSGAAHALYCHSGYAVINAGSESFMLGAGDLLVIESSAEGEELSYGVMGEGTLIRAQVFYGETAGGPEIIPRQRATFDDFKACVYLANVQFRWAKYLVKSLKTKWFDEELSRAINLLERCYATTIVFVIGIAALAVLEARGPFSAGQVLLLALVWIVVDSLLVSPAIYMLAVPKPVRAHIKDVDKLTPYEKKVREQELAKDPFMEKMKRKYDKHTRMWGEESSQSEGDEK